MNHTADVAQGHETAAVEEEKMEKQVAHIPPGEGGKSLWAFGEFVTHKIPSQRTGGAYALFEVATQPGAGPPSDVHHREGEAFCMLEGEFEFSAGNMTLRVEAGSLLFLPKGTLHAHENVGEGTVRMLVTRETWPWGARPIGRPTLSGGLPYNGKDAREGPNKRL